MFKSWLYVAIDFWATQEQRQQRSLVNIEALNEFARGNHDCKNFRAVNLFPRHLHANAQMQNFVYLLSMQDWIRKPLGLFPIVLSSIPMQLEGFIADVDMEPKLALYARAVQCDI